MEGQENLSGEQKALQAQTIHKLSGVFAEVMLEMTMINALETLTNFFAAAVVHLFDTAGRLEYLQGKVVGKEIERRIGYAKAQRNGREKEQRHQGKK